MTGGDALRLHGLEVSFPAPGGGRVRAVRGVDLALGAGRVLAVIGESGSGKSTVLLAIAGLLGKGAAVIGNLHLAGVPGDLLAPGVSRRGVAGRHIGMVFQNPGASLNPVLTIGSQIDEVVATHQALSGVAVRAATLSLLARVGVGDTERRAAAFPHQLSGGLKQRVAIAAALAGRPRLVLADEPTTALDATVQAQIFDLLLDLVDRDGIGLILVTHDMAVAGSVADDIAVMYAGRVVESGPARELMDRPAHPYTAALIAAALPLAPGPAPARGDAPFPELPPPDMGAVGAGCDFAPRCRFATDQCRAARPAPEAREGRLVACFEAGKGAP